MSTIKQTITLMLLSIPFLSFAKKDKPATVITQEIIINASIDKAWEILGPEFSDAYKWATSIKHSQANNSESFNGSTCSERGCDVAGFGKIKEKILQYSEEKHILAYEVVEGKPGMVSFMSNTWQLENLENGKSKLVMRMEMKTKGLMGAMMKGMMKKKLTKLSGEVTEEFKYYVENGTPHPRKLKAMKKNK